MNRGRGADQAPRPRSFGCGRHPPRENACAARRDPVYLIPPGCGADRQGRLHPLQHHENLGSAVTADSRRVLRMTLDALEGVTWGPPTFDSGLATTCHRLRSKPLGEYDTEDLRIMIGQNIGLPWLLPLAIDRLEEDPWASGAHYPGDLLTMTVRAKFSWITQPDLRERLRAVIARALRDLTSPPDVDEADFRIPSGKLTATLLVELRTALERLDAEHAG
jgi:hypothetical protein